MHKYTKYILAGALVIAAGLAAWWYFRPGGVYVTPSRADHPLRGIDISAHNGKVDFEAVAADSIDFVIIKATEGTAFKDAAFRRNYALARQAGLKVGVYHFFRFDAPGRLQAVNLLHSLRGRPVDLPVVIDIEEWTNPTDRPTHGIVAELREMIATLEEQGLHVMLYSNKDGYSRFLRNNFGSYPLWIASLTGEPGEEWTLWQFTHRGSVGGVNGHVDINTFSGGRADWEAWLATYPGTPDEERAQ